MVHAVNWEHKIASTNSLYFIENSFFQVKTNWFSHNNLIADLTFTVSLPCFVMRQDVFLRLAVQNVDVVIRQVKWLYPVTGSINHQRDASTFHAARDQHRHQAYG